MKECDRVIQKTLELVKQMIQLADYGDAVREDDGCGILYSVLRDSAFKIGKLARAEKEAHIRKGWWQEENNNKLNGSMSNYPHGDYQRKMP